MSRCQCGAFVRACKSCGEVPGGSTPDLFSPARIARIDARARELKCKNRYSVGDFIDDECKGVAS